MNTSNGTRTSFFDDDDLKIVFEFQKPGQQHQKDLSTPAIFSSKLNRQTNSEGMVTQGTFALHNRTLAYYKNIVGNQPDAVLVVAHSRLHALPVSLNSNKFGFTLTKNGVKYEFTSSEEQVIENWRNVLKNVCVLTEFHEEYKASKMIGKGSFAKVYLVDSKSSGKAYAVKAFTKESVILSNKSNAKPSMLNEIDIMRALEHENVIRLYEVYETEKSIYLVLELIQGKALQEVLKKGGFKDNEARTMNVISSILEALAYLGAKNVMHRDLKPDNILLDKGDKAKIVDFGLATFIDLPEYIFKKCGTPGYIAPEVFKYDQNNTATSYNEHCDVFSAGCILYFMLFNAAFFDGPNASEILKSNRRFGPEFQNITTLKKEIKDPNSTINKEGLDLCLKLLEFDHKKRISAAQALNHPYLLPIMQQKQAGSYDVYQTGGYSPNVHDRRGSFAQEHMIQSSRSTNGNQQRFAEKDSLYLDLGKPEINGKIDTLTNGSNNNSLLLKQEGASPSSASPHRNPTRSSSFKVHASGNGGTGNQSVLKAAIHRNMQNNNDEDQKEDNNNLIRNRLQEVKQDRRHSDSATSGKGTTFTKASERGYAPDDEEDDISQEDPQLQRNVEKMNLRTNVKHPSKLVESPARRLGGMSPAMNKGLY